MPLTHTRTFRVRYYECDAYGHVNNANYLRYMQEAAFDASTAAGYGLARYAALGHHWLIRETDIEYIQPLRYGDTVQVKTWVVDFQRVRSRRAYEFRRDGADELVARAGTDWVYLDDATGRPAPIPSEMMAAFFPEGLPAEATAPRERPAPAPPPPPGVFRMRRRVEWRDIDQVGHVNNAVYLSYIEDCGIQVAAAYGWPMARMGAAGFALVARRHQIEYKQPAVLDDEMEVSTWIGEVRRTSVVRHYTITRVSDGALLARCRTYWVWIDPQTGRPIRVPDAFMADFASNIAGA